MGLKLPKSKTKEENYFNTTTTQVPKVSFELNKFFAVAFTDRWYPGRCNEIIDEQTAFIEFLHPSGKHYKWPTKPDIQRVHLSGTLSEVSVEPISNGRLWIVPQAQQNHVDNMFTL